MLEDAINKMSNNPNGIFESMAQEYLGPTHTGKRVFIDKVN